MTTRYGLYAGLALVIATTQLGARLARADIDLTGTWQIDVSIVVVQVSIVQMGTSLNIEGAVGTIDPVSGAFSVEGGDLVFPQCTYIKYQGVATDSNSMSGTVSIAEVLLPSPPGTCGVIAFSFIGVRVPICGNGILEPGEQCDDGNPFALDCCTATCLLDPAGSPCAGDVLQCTDDLCDGAGHCMHPPAGSGTICRPAAGACDVAESCDGSTSVCPADQVVPAGTICRPAAGACDVAETCDGSTTVCPADLMPPDSDGDGLADVCDPCPTGTQADRPRLRLGTYDGVPNNDALRAAGKLVLSSAAAAFLDPVAQGLEVVIGAPGTPGELDVVVPPGAFDALSHQGWRVSPSGRTWKFRGADPTLAVARASVRLSLEDPPHVVVRMRGRRRNFAAVLPELPLPFRIILAPPGATSPACGEAVFVSPGASSPRCETRSNGTVLTCR